MLSRLFHLYRMVLVPGIIVTALLVLLSGFAVASFDQTGQLWAPYLEWSFENPTYSGNPFDLVALATFTHTSSGETRKTELFYDGGTTWKLRFAGTRTGEWTFRTTSADPELDGKSGTVTINPNPGVYGFTTNSGNKWARQIDEDGNVEAFIPQFISDNEEDLNNWDQTRIDNLISTFIVTHGFTGIQVFIAASWADIDAGTDWDNVGDLNPDTASFDALELYIKEIHDAGGITHIWAYGDCARDQCPDKGFGTAGAATIEEQRILRYIAARLGPMPGWIMGYGFDVPEYGSTAEIDGWHDYLQSKLGWPHLLSARNQSKTVNQYGPFGDWWSWGEYSPDWTYAQVVSAMDQETTKPHSLDEKFYSSRGFTMADQRRHMWQHTMAGGASALWAYTYTGTFPDSYPNPEQIKTYSTFWKRRFLSDMTRENTLTDGYCLKNDNNYIFYKEDATSIQMNLSGVTGAPQAIAVDTKLTYSEVDLGALSTTNQTWTAPYKSDWAIAVGDFSERPSDTSPSTAPQSLEGIAIGESRIDLTWQAASDPESGISGYKVYRDDTFIGQSTTTSFSDLGLAENSTYVYEVSAVNGAGLESEKSAQISATTLADTIAPTVVSVTTSSDPNKVTVVFSEPVEQASAEDISNYGIDNGITISGASLASDLQTVTLTTFLYTEGITYTLTVNNIRDRASIPNMIAADTQVTYTFAGQLVISNLAVDSGKAYEVIENGLESGSLVYIDRGYTFSEVPDSLAGATYIKTANDDKNSSGSSSITFDVNQNVTVYVGHDNRITTKPSWMASFTDTGDDLVTIDTTLSLYAKDFPAGTVTLGGNEGSSNSMYSVIIVRQGGSPPAAPAGVGIVNSQ